jgi:LuxR family maltose regulon positive regulatory protein
MYNSSLLVLVHQASAGQDPSRSIAGIGLASRLIDRALRGPSLIVALEALQLRAQLYGSAAVCPTGAPTDADAGHADYVRALQLGEPEGFVGVFVEQGPRVAEDLAHLAEQGELGTVQPNYVEEILTASSAAWVRSTASQESPSPPSRIGPRSLAEPLTDREVDVLRLMSQGLKYKEIAEELFISLNTVRYHVKGIYGKLDVSNRTQAIETARQFRLL